MQTSTAVGSVTSADGTRIEFETTGTGRPLVLVHGTTADRSRWRPLLPHLQPHVTCVAMDRRGRGGSDDTEPYDVQREFDDVAAVVEAVAATHGGPVDVYGHSMGAFVAWGAAVRTPTIRRLALYEGWPQTGDGADYYPAGLEEKLVSLLAEGRNEDAVTAYFRGMLDMTDEQFEQFRSQPSWQARVKAAPTILREDKAHAASRFDAAEASRITVPTLLITGSESSETIRGDIEAVAAALPDGRILELEGQEHVADVLVPEVFAAHLLPFVLD